jgi:uncharacterized protein
MIFEILAERDVDDQKTFFYDNVTNTLSDETGHIYENTNIAADNRPISLPFSKHVPLKKTRQVRKLKIQLGLSCNYSCDYCSQKFVERPPETSKRDIDNFMSMLDSLDFSGDRQIDIEFWGGEPLVYWKTLRPLAEAIRERLAHLGDKLQFGIITNGSILTPEICDWLVEQNFWVGISHDGPGQWVRGPDPFDDPKKRAVILNLYRTLHPLNKISFNAMLHSKNRSRKKIRQWFVDLTGDPHVRVGEGDLVDSYDDDAIDISLSTSADHFDFRIKSFNEMYSTTGNFGFFNGAEKIKDFKKSVLNHRSVDTIGQKCGMDNPAQLAIDMKGNVLTCQNVSAIEQGMNGESHLGGHVTDIEAVEIKSSTHWKNRPDCASCPVISLCKGACMFLDNKYWESTCNNAYTDNIVYFSIAFEQLTEGYIPVLIKNTHLPDNRRDIWGTILTHTDAPKKKVIPIKSVVDKKIIVNDIAVYEQARKKEITDE